MYGYNFPNYQQYQQYQQPTQDERIWVQNETSAEAYLVAPNGFVRLWDSSKPVFYEKRADANGRPLPLEAYEYSKRALNKPIDIEGIDSYYKEALEGLTRRIEALEKEAHNESNADISTVSTVQETVSRKPTARGTKADS